MNVYIVRHGRSIGNEMRIHQDSNSELSEDGLKQANLLANRFKNIDIDLIVASPFTRAQQTAKIINKNLNKPIENSDHFIEIKRPTIIENLNVLDENVVKIREEIRKNYHDPSYRHSDEETFFELKDRAIKALKFLEKKREENILVVTHGEFIRCIFGIITMGNDFGPNTLIRLDETLRSYNTGITLCKYEKNWEVITWNDINHLG